jgi:hypothetical protein
VLFAASPNNKDTRSRTNAFSSLRLKFGRDTF